MIHITACENTLHCEILMLLIYIFLKTTGLLNWDMFLACTYLKTSKNEKLHFPTAMQVQHFDSQHLINFHDAILLSNNLIKLSLRKSHFTGKILEIFRQTEQSFVGCLPEHSHSNIRWVFPVHHTHDTWLLPANHTVPCQTSWRESAGSFSGVYLFFKRNNRNKMCG